MLGFSPITAFVYQQSKGSTIRLYRYVKYQKTVFCSFLAHRSPRSIRLYIVTSISKTIANCLCGNPSSTLPILILYTNNIHIHLICHYLTNISFLLDLYIKNLLFYALPIKLISHILQLRLLMYVMIAIEHMI